MNILAELREIHRFLNQQADNCRWLAEESRKSKREDLQFAYEGQADAYDTAAHLIEKVLQAAESERGL